MTCADRVACAPGAASLSTPRPGQARNNTAATIRDAQRAGDLPRGADPLLAAAASFGALREVLVEALSRPRRPAQEQIVELVWRQFAAALRFDPDLAAQLA